MHRPIRPIVAALVAFAVMPLPAARADQDGHHDNDRVRYRVTVLPSLGGTSSLGTSIDHGQVAGRSNLPGNGSRHATLWRDGALVDLGTLGGPNSAVLWPVKNGHGVISGISQTNEVDPTNEFWSCSFFFPAASRTGRRCVGFRWEHGAMTALPTLGGRNGFATGTNQGGYTVGWAENTVIDATCVAPGTQQFRAVVWGPDGRVSRQLPPLAGDTTSAATALNDRGQVIGISGICDQAAGRFSAAHAVLWENGVPVPIGSLGGVAWNTPTAINQEGDVVGFANASAADAGDFDPRAFLWRKGHGLQPLGALPNHVTTQASGINSRREIVGQSCDADGNCRAVLWRHFGVTDLNDVLDGAASTLTLTTADDVDDEGRITGQGYDAAGGQFVAYVAVPVRR